MFKQAHLVNNCRAFLKEKHILTCLTSWWVSTPLVYIHPKEMKKGCANIAFVIITKKCEYCLLINILQILIIWSRAQQLKGTRDWRLHTTLPTLWFYLHVIMKTTKVQEQKLNQRLRTECSNLIKGDEAMF